MSNSKSRTVKIDLKQAGKNTHDTFLEVNVPRLAEQEKEHDKLCEKVKNGTANADDLYRIKRLEKTIKSLRFLIDLTNIYKSSNCRQKM